MAVMLNDMSFKMAKMTCMIILDDGLNCRMLGESVRHEQARQEVT